MSSYESTPTGGNLDSGGDEIMIGSYDIGTPMYDRNLLQPNVMPGIGNPFASQWPLGSPHPSMGAASDASSIYGSISPRTDLGHSPLWPDRDPGLQLQEAMCTGKRTFQNNLTWCGDANYHVEILEHQAMSTGYDTARNTSREQRTFLEPNWDIMPPQMQTQPWPTVQEPGLMAAADSKARVWDPEPASSMPLSDVTAWLSMSRDTLPPPSLSTPTSTSSVLNLDECETPVKFKEESPVSMRESSGSSLSKTVARRVMKRASRNGGKSRGSSRRDSIQSDLDEGECSGSDHTRTGRTRPAKYFACPFYRMDPKRHMDCVNYKLKRIRDVKQHIYRRHIRGPHYCPECLATFSTAEPWEKHYKARSCQAPASGSRTSILGVDEEMQSELAKPADKKLSPEGQWYAMLDILFGGMPKPAKPYLGTLVQETVGMMRDYWHQDGDEMIHDVLKHKKSSGERAAELSALMKALFDTVQARFEPKRRQPGAEDMGDTQQFDPAPLRSDSNGSEPKIHLTPASEPDFRDWTYVNREMLGNPQPEMGQMSAQSTWGTTQRPIGPETNMPGISLAGRHPLSVSTDNLTSYLTSFSLALNPNQAPGRTEDSHQQVMNGGGCRRNHTI